MEKFIHDEYTLTAMKLVREGKSFFITGKAGTGKTRLLGEIVRESRARGKNIVVAAPTGVAAKNAEGQTLSYLSTNVIKKQILKPKDREESDKFYNYPYQALEETVVNSLYHRDWTIREPVEITIEPDRISILNFSGPNHTIPMEAIREGKSLRSRRYRNRRLGEFLKELDLTEGRSTGVPTIQEKLADNGSPRATFETTEDRLTFLIHIPIHAGCGNKPATEKTTVITTEKSAIGSEKNGSGSEKSSEKNQAIISAIRLNPKVTAAEIAMKLGVSSRAVEKRIKTLRENGVIRRIGGDKGGYWEVIENGTEQ